MADAKIFQIEEGELGFALVDTAAVGYVDTWQAPGGKTALTADATVDYPDSAGFVCQVTSAAVTASANDNNVEIPATFCSPARTVPQPGETSFALEGEFLQDPHIVNGLSRYLFEHDTEEAYVLIGYAAGDPPRAIGRVRLIAGAIGGAARDNLTATVTLPFTRKPDIAFGDATDSEIVEGSGNVADIPAPLDAAADDEASAEDESSYEQPELAGV